ncbi:MAG: HAMP domain-containing sensor histidine kinase [Zavarzinella sp.]
MARRRLRNRMLLGLCLVVASLAVLLAGSMYGLSAYRANMRTTEDKLTELLKLDELKPVAAGILAQPVAKPAPAEGPLELFQDDPRTAELRHANERLLQTRELFHKYVATYRQGATSDMAQPELLPAVDKALQQLEAAIDGFSEVQPVNRSTPLAVDPQARQHHEQLLRLIDELRAEVSTGMYETIRASRTTYQRSALTVGIASVVAVLLLISLISWYSSMIFRPIRQLMAGVRRVTNGDFSQPIMLKSGDELEELAVAFNEMTARLHAVYVDLEHKVDERSRQLVKSERMVSVGFLAAGVSHEINNPLASIAFCAEALQTRLANYLQRYPEETEVIAKYLKMIQQEAFRCKGITSKLLEFSRMGERRRDPSEMTELVQTVLEIAQHLQQCRGKRIIFQPYTRVTALVCAEDLKSVVLNLVVNALENMDEGGVLTITLRVVGPTVEMQFTDTGVGMNSETLQNIFEPFFTRNRTGKGTGLGLFISHHIVDQHGGEINATSAGPGNGSTFTVRIPLQPSNRQDAGDWMNVLPFGNGAQSHTKTEEGIGHAA